jgi:rhodanese-related sulfurtransferase
MFKKIYTIFIILFLITKPAIADVIDINNDQIKKLMKLNTPIIDIRTSPEWNQTGVVPNSLLLTFFDKNGKYNFENWYNKLIKITKEDQPVILICRSGRRTKIVAEMMNRKFNFIVYNAKYGIKSWIKSNLKTVAP